MTSCRCPVTSHGLAWRSSCGLGLASRLARIRSFIPFNARYELSSALVHSGSAYGGHYMVYTRDVASGRW